MSSISREIIDGPLSEAEEAEGDALIGPGLHMDVLLESHDNHLVISINHPLTMSKLSQSFILNGGEVMNDYGMAKPEALETNVELRLLYDLATTLYGLDGVSNERMIIDDYVVHVTVGRAFNMEIVAMHVIRAIANFIEADLENVSILITGSAANLQVPYDKFVKAAGAEPLKKLTKKERHQLEDLALKLTRTKSSQPTGRSLHDLLMGSGNSFIGM